MPAASIPPTNSWPTARARAALPPCSPDALSPPPFPLDDPPQRLTARRAAKPLARAATGAYEALFTPRTVAAKKIEIVRWGLTLAGLPRRRAVRLRCRGNCCLGFSPGLGAWVRLPGLRLPGFGCRRLGAATSIPLALSLPFFPHFRFLAILPAATFPPPSPSRLAALGTAVPGLGMGGAKWFLAFFEQTTSLARPTSPLTGSRFARS